MSKRPETPKPRIRGRRRSIDPDAAAAFVEGARAPSHNSTNAQKRINENTQESQSADAQKHESANHDSRKYANAKMHTGANPKNNASADVKMERLHVELEPALMERLRIAKIKQPRGQRSLRKIVRNALVDWLDANNY